MKEFIGASLAAAVWLVGGLLVDDYIKLHEQVARVEKLHSQPTVPASKKGEQDAPQTYVLGMTLADFIMVGLTFSIAFFTGGLLIEEKDRSRKELRAYLGAVPQDVLFVGDNWIQAHVEIENTGSTPAQNVTHWTDWDIRVPTDNTNFPIPKEPGFGKRPIAPGGKWPLGFERQLTPQQLAGLQMKATALFVWGAVQYQDIYGKTHSLTFRFQNIGVVFGTDAHGERKHFGWSLFAVPEGNEAS